MNTTTNHTPAPAPHITSIAPRLLIGLAILTVGLLWTLDNFDVIESEPITRWWPVVLILLGIVRLLDRGTGKIGSIVLILAGSAILLDKLDIWEFSPRDIIPILIVIFGAKLIFDALKRRNPSSGAPAVTEVSDATSHPFALMAGVQRRNTSMDFRGGSANAIMGGIELDLRGAQIPAGQQAVIDTFAFWGGIEIKVPESWRVVNEVLPLMGACEDKTAGKAETNGPALIVRGVAIMGGIEVKN